MARKTKKHSTKKRTVKRRRTRLGDTAEGHAAKAVTAAELAHEMFVTATRYANFPGGCAQAVAEYGGAQYHFGRASAHAKEANPNVGIGRSRSMHGPVLDARAEAESALQRACLVTADPRLRNLPR